MKKIEAIELAAIRLLQRNVAEAKTVIDKEYPFHKLIAQGRNYTDKEKMAQFVRDGFIDRYSGEKLVNPGILKVLSYYMPEEFPYHAHWKMEECHNAYWELHAAGDYGNYDGLTELFVKLVESDNELLKDFYIKRWYKLSKNN